MPPDPDFLTPERVRELLGFRKVDSVYALIRSGALAAVDVSPSGGRSLWRITRAAFDRFVTSRTSAPALAPARPKRVKRPKVTTYF